MTDPDARIRELHANAERILGLALKKGAQRAAVSASWGMNSRIQYEKNDFNIAAVHEATGFGITVHKDSRSGSASVNSLDSAAIERTVETALSMARFSVPDEYLAMAKPAEYKKLPPVFDPEIAEFPMSGVRRLAEAMISSAGKDGRISIDNAEVESSVGVRVIANTNGVRAADSGTSLSWSMMGMAIQGDDVTNFDHLSGFSYRSEGCEEKVRATATELSTRLLACLGAGKGVSYRGCVLLPPSVAEEILVDPIIYHMLGTSIMDGKSRLADSLGAAVTHESLSFRDRPHDTRLRGCAAFSGEGVPTEEMALLEHGVLRRHLDTVYSASRRGTRPTGNGGGPHCLDVEAGPFALSELRRREATLLEVGRFSGSMDCVTGDFSGVAKGSFLYRNGEFKGPVREVMIAGNAFNILGQEMLFSAERRDDGGCYFVPYALVRNVSVTAS